MGYVHNVVTLDNGIKVDEYHKNQLPFLLGITTVVSLVFCVLAGTHHE